MYLPLGSLEIGQARRTAWHALPATGPTKTLKVRCPLFDSLRSCLAFPRASFHHHLRGTFPAQERHAMAIHFASVPWLYQRRQRPQGKQQHHMLRAAEEQLSSTQSLAGKRFHRKKHSRNCETALRKEPRSSSWHCNSRSPQAARRQLVRSS